MTGVPITLLWMLLIPFPAPHSIAGLLWAIASLPLVFLLSVNLDLLAGLSAFWTKGMEGILHLSGFLIPFLSGWMIPLPLFPAPLQPFLRMLPYAGLADTPISLYQQGPTPQNLCWLAISCGWCIALSLLNRWLFRRGLRRFTMEG